MQLSKPSITIRRQRPQDTNPNAIVRPIVICNSHRLQSLQSHPHHWLQYQAPLAFQSPPSSKRVLPGPLSAFAFIQPHSTPFVEGGGPYTKDFYQHQQAGGLPLSTPSSHFPTTHVAGHGGAPVPRFDSVPVASSTSFGSHLPSLALRSQGAGTIVGPDSLPRSPSSDTPSVPVPLTTANTTRSDAPQANLLMHLQPDVDSVVNKPRSCWICNYKFSRQEDELEHAKGHNVVLSEEKDFHFMSKVVALVMERVTDEEHVNRDSANEENSGVITSCGLVRKMKPLRDGIMSRHYIQNLFLRLEEAGIGTVNIRRNGTIRKYVRPFGDRDRACVNAYSIGDARLLKKGVQIPRSVVFIPRQRQDILSDKRCIAFLRQHSKAALTPPSPNFE